MSPFRFTFSFSLSSPEKILYRALHVGLCAEKFSVLALFVELTFDYLLQTVLSFQPRRLSVTIPWASLGRRPVTIRVKGLALAVESVDRDVRKRKRRKNKNKEEREAKKIEKEKNERKKEIDGPCVDTDHSQRETETEKGCNLAFSHSNFCRISM